MITGATVLASTLVAGHEAAYERDHARIPDDLIAALRAGGVRDWVIWREGLRLLHVVLVDDYDALAAELADDPANLRWQQSMADHVVRFEAVDSIPALRAPVLVWAMAEQLERDSFLS